MLPNDERDIKKKTQVFTYFRKACVFLCTFLKCVIDKEITYKGMGYKVISVTNAVSTGLFIGGTINV